MDLADEAFAKIEAPAKAVAKKPDDVNDKPSKPYVKPRRVIQAAALTPKPYLETQADIDAYLDKPRTALKTAISDGVRVEIR